MQSIQRREESFWKTLGPYHPPPAKKKKPNNTTSLKDKKNVAKTRRTVEPLKHNNPCALA